MTTSTVTTVVVFLPLGLLTGVDGTVLHGAFDHADDRGAGVAGAGAHRHPVAERAVPHGDANVAGGVGVGHRADRRALDARRTVRTVARARAARRWRRVVGGCCIARGRRRRLAVGGHVVPPRDGRRRLRARLLDARRDRRSPRPIAWCARSRRSSPGSRRSPGTSRRTGRRARPLRDDAEPR